MVFILWVMFLYGSLASDDFIIDTAECQIPNFPAFSQETNSTHIQLPYVTCSSLDLLTYTKVENNIAHLRIKEEYLNQYYKSQEEIDCCYSYVTRKGTVKEPDVGFRISSCHPFNSSATLEGETVIVRCYLGADKIYENVHSPIVVKKSVKRKLSRQSETQKKPLSVLFIVVDSVSRLNLERTMPLTRKFLLENNFIDFLGYNKIDDNTFPNFNALLTGMNLRQSYSTCKPKVVGMLDHCPMIWYNFRDQGYVTAYAEDWASISTFNYFKKGFKKPPTDYYFKPYMEATEALPSLILDSMPYCAGPETAGERILNLAGDFAKTFKGSPSFGIFWMNTFSHNYLNSPTRMDEKVADFFLDLQQHGILNESMVVFLSDHGMRFGGIQRTIQGWYEERLCTNMISLPPWFQRAYPEKYNNLKENAGKLTSTYDLYLTLQEVLLLSVDNYTTSKSKACDSCQSLFSVIPELRNCKQAGIPEGWCTCLGKFHENDAELTPEMNAEALRFVRQSNKLTGFNIDKILHSAISRDPKKRKYFLIWFQTDPYAIHQALLRLRSNSLEFIKLIQIKRLY